jgi:hypothetical protein
MQQICEKCGKVNLADAIYCTGCKSDLRAQDGTVILHASSVAAAAATAETEQSPSGGLASRFNTCPSCSTVNVANASICRSCGHRLASDMQTPAVTQTSLAHVSDLDETRPPIPSQEPGAASLAAGSKKLLWMVMGVAGLLIAAALVWWLMNTPSSSKEAPVKPNPFALPPEAMVSAPVAPAAPASQPVPVLGSTSSAQDISSSVPSVSQSLSPQETIVAASTPASGNTRQLATRDTASKQASSIQEAASSPGKKEVKAADATRPGAQTVAAARTASPPPNKESSSARTSGAAASNSASADASSASPQPAPSAQANSPKEVCSTRFALVQPFCMQEQCGLPRFTNHAQCVQMRAQQQETQQKMLDRN